MLLQDGSGTPKPFRYNIALKGKGNAVHCFEPKPLTEAVNVMQLRSSMFGAIFTGKLAKFPKSDMAQLVWEAILGFSVMIVFCFFLWPDRWHWSTTSSVLWSQSTGSLVKFPFLQNLQWSLLERVVGIEQLVINFLNLFLLIDPPAFE